MNGAATRIRAMRSASSDRNGVAEDFSRCSAPGIAGLMVAPAAVAQTVTEWEPWSFRRFSPSLGMYVAKAWEEYVGHSPEDNVFNVHWTLES